MKRYLIVFLMCSSLFLVGCGKTEEPEPEKPIAVSVQKAVGGEIENTNAFSGTTKVKDETAVTAQTVGTVQEVYVKLGQNVRKGDELLSISSPDLENSVKQSKAALDLAKASYSSTTGGSLEAQVNQAKTALDNAKIQYDESQRNYDNNKILYEQEVISLDQFKKIEFALEQSKQQLDSAQRSYDTVTSKSIPQAKALAKKQLDQAQVSYNLAMSNLDKLTLTAPVDGTITAKNFDAKEMITQSQPAFIISNPNILEVNLNVAESDIDKFKKDGNVEVIIEDQRILGKIDYVPSVVDPQTSLYPIKVLVNNTNNKFKAGMSAQVNLSVEKENGAVTVPKKAIFEEKEKKYVYIANKDNIAKKKLVQTGIVTEDKIEIKSGVSEKDTVVIGGISLISDGTKIFPVEKEK
ncbi:TPA: efflux RND transporter periplasmic adaptor subunit [Clostridioides difficile]|nr:efflux RND transporter periplasmic adaptor subunit [Clostridioides difficile]